MSTTTDDFNQDDENGQGSEKKNWRRDLEEKAEKAEERATAAEAQLATVQRQTALNSAGLDLSVNEEGKPNNPLHKFFADKYDGKLEADAIKAAAQETGIIQPAQQDTQTQQIASQHAQLDRASLGAPAVPPVGTQEAVLDKIGKASAENDSRAFYAALAEAGMTVRG